MTSISVDEARKDLTGLLHRVQAGEVLVITEDNEPVAELRPVAPGARGPRPSGLCAGEFVVPDGFDDPFDLDLWGTG
ncbi:MAG TPA: type II toxin-antitoxin system prevent-host-death family antitoxin [Armatimonadota bacterium]|nr:type II toxin-antitoxin system prevent-host-death family antitoxin [Armatimonadota bacterium]